MESLLCRHLGEGTRLLNDMEALRELLATYEQSIQRKDQVISNLTAGLQHHRNRMEVQRSFTEWKLKHNDVKREVLLSCFMFFCERFVKCVRNNICVWLLTTKYSQ